MADRVSARTGVNHHLNQTNGVKLRKSATTMHHRFRDRFLGAWADLVCQRPRLTLGAALLLAALSVWWTATHLGFEPDRSNLVAADLSWNARYLEYKDRYPRWGDVLLIVERTATPDDHTRDDPAEDFVRDISVRLRSESLVESVTASFETDPRMARLILSLPDDLFEQVWPMFQWTAPIVRSPSMQHWFQTSQRTGAEPASGDELRQLSELLAHVGRAADDSSVPLFPGLNEARLLESASGDLLFVSIAIRPDAGEVASVAEGITVIRAHVSELRQSDPRYRSLRAGVTGIPAIESDETIQATHDATVSSSVAAVLIAFLLIFVFRGVAVPLYAMLALGIGVAWSFGYLTLVIGHLQVLSVVFTVILLGLGIDFALHLLARLELIRDEYDHPGPALKRVFRGVGPGMLTGALTTAASFGIMGLTDFRGMAEMGIIAGGGIMLCLIAMLSVFPALLCIHPGGWKAIIHVRPGGEHAHFARGVLDGVSQHPRRTLFLCALMVGALGFAAQTTRYDPNILNLHPPGIESVIWETRLIEDGEQSVWVGLSLAHSIEEAESRTLAFLEETGEISSVGGVGMLFHSKREARALMARTFAKDAGIVFPMPPDDESRPPTALAAAATLRALGEHILNADTAGRQLPALVADQCRALAERLETSDGDQAWARVEISFDRDAAAFTAAWAALLDPALPSIGDLPPPVQALNVGTDGSLLLRLYPTDTGESVLDPERLEKFVTAMRRVDPAVLGPAVQIHESSRLIIRAYMLTAIYALLIIMALLFIDFRSLADTLCALVPVLFGFVGMFGIMGLASIPLNFANIIVMPLIFGIGVDAGVHMVHRWRLQPEGVPKGLSGGTGRGITLTMMTTMIGFACMMIAEHRGIRGLGLTMTIGLAVTLFACYTALPAILAHRRPSHVVPIQ